MDLVLLFSIIAMSAVALVMATVIYIVAQKFHVEVDPRVDEVFEMLPAANCGGCGFPGCKAFANKVVASVKESNSIEGLNCPVGGAPCMEEIAKFLHLELIVKDPTIAVVRCGGSCELAPAKTTYLGPKKCSIAHAVSAGESGCSFGCLGCGDCVVACPFDAIAMDDKTGLPVVKESCVSCGKCVKACPRNLIEIRPRGNRSRRVWVNCRNTERGGIAMKNCKVTCIGCGKCAKECKVDAITVANNLAYVDAAKCVACGKCVPVCPTKAMQQVNIV